MKEKNPRKILVQIKSFNKNNTKAEAPRVFLSHYFLFVCGRLATNTKYIYYRIRKYYIETTCRPDYSEHHRGHIFKEAISTFPK